MTTNTPHAHLICGAGPVVALPHGGQQRHGVWELEQAGGEDWVQRGVCLGPEVAAPHGLDHAGAVLLPLPPQRARDRVVAGPVSLYIIVCYKVVQHDINMSSFYNKISFFTKYFKSREQVRI